MNNSEIENIIREAERRVENSAFIGARLMGMFSLLLTPFVFIGGLNSFVSCLAVVCGGVTVQLWEEGKKLKRELMKERTLSLWKKVDYVGAFGEKPSAQERKLMEDIGRIYERDPQGTIFPLPQAIRLMLAWKQQQQRLQTIEARIKEVQIVRTALQEKQKLLHELNDDDPAIERALLRLNDDILPLKKSRDTLRDSRTRLESLIGKVDAILRRRELHREVGQLTAHLPVGGEAHSFDVPDENLDIERQIGREIETYLQLECETATHLRDL